MNQSKKLSPREREVFSLVLRGMVDVEIAEALCITLKTAQAHKIHIRQKLGVREGRLTVYAVQTLARRVAELERQLAVLGVAAEGTAK